MMRRKVKDLGIRVGMICASLLFTLILLEVGFRLFYPQFGGCEFGERDPELGARLTSGYSGVCIGWGHDIVTLVEINPQGFRNQLIQIPKPTNVYRILMLGDSTTFGLGVNESETIPAVLDSELKNNSPLQRYEVINAGVPGYGTAQEWLLYKRWVHDLDPDLVILMFLIANDIEDNMCFDHSGSGPCFTIDQNELVLKDKKILANASASAPVQNAWAVNDLHTYVFFRYHIRNLVAGNPAVIRLLTRIGLQFKTGSLPPTLHSWYHTTFATEGWQLTQALLDALLSDTQKDGIPLVLVILPERPQTTENYAILTSLLYGDTPEFTFFHADPRRPQRILLRWAEKRGVPALDTLGPLKQAASSNSIHLADGHFNALGNQVIALDMKNFLLESGLLD